MKKFLHKLGWHSYNDVWEISAIKQGSIRTCTICGKKQVCRVQNKNIWWWEDLNNN